MDIGKLRERITIQQPGIVQDDTGGAVPGWTDFAANVPAKKRDLSGREYVAADAVQNSAVTEFEIRYLAGVVEKMRVVHETVNYDIEAVLGEGRVSRKLMCRRVAQ